MKYAFFFSILFLGCVTASTTLLSSKQYPPTVAEEVVIYLTVDDIDGEFEKLATTTLKGDHSYTDENALYKKARKEAAKIGANGILVNQVKDPTTGSKVAQWFLGTPSNRVGEVLLIRVKEKTE